MAIGRLLTSLLLICSPLALAAPAPIEMHHMSWTAREGAPQMVIAMTQTQDGWLWLGNNNGLFRFDGVRFERYAEPGHTLPATAIATLSTFNDGALWIGYRYGGISVLSGGQLRHYNQRDGLPASAGVWGLEHDGAGRLWAATSKGLFHLDGQRWIAADAAFAVPTTFYKTLLRDRSGNLWAQGDEGVYRLPAAANQFIKATPDNGTGVVLEAPDGSVWSWNAPRASLRRLTQTTGGATPANRDIHGNAASLLLDSHGDVWVGRMNGLEYHTLREVQQSGPEQGLSGSRVGAMFEDREGNVWISTATGIDRFRRKRIAAVTLPVATDIYPLATDAEGGVWVGRFHVMPGAQGSFAVKPAWPGPAVNWGIDPVTVHRDRAGVLWLAPYGELWRKAGQTLRRMPMPQRDGMIISMTTDAEGTLWAAVRSHGLYRLRPDGVWQHMADATGLADQTPGVVVHSPQQGLWLGYSQSRVLQFQHGQWRWYGAADGLALGMTQAIHLKGPHVWVGGESGVALGHNGRFIAVGGADGVSFEGVSGIVELDNGDVWLNAVNGLFHIEAAEVARLKATRGYRVRYERLDNLDGLVGNAPARVPVPSMIQASNGQLWLATTTGAFRLDPSQRPTSAPAAPVQIRALGQPGQLKPAQDGQRLAENTTALQIDYTALALAMPERVAFRYRLDGVDQEWQQAGARRTAYYNNLGPGAYRFSVQATNYQGVWGDQATTLRFSIAPTVTQSWWFKALCALLLLAACWMLYRWRLRTFAGQVAARLQERTRERERIARELHDTLLQSVQGMILHVHAAVLGLPSREPARLMIEQALQQADDVLLEGRDRVRDLRASEPDQQDLALAIDSAGRRLRMPDAASLRVEVEGQPRMLHPLVYEEVLAIATEAVANAYRHAEAKAITVQLRYSAHEFRLAVHDDGIGVPADVMHAGGRSDHWGVCGMRERAQRINARLKLHSTAGAGTEWRLALPALLAYRPACA
jgi:signal transduction histidine kinase/ligand-binding sensor domain-containing protein